MQAGIKFLSGILLVMMLEKLSFRTEYYHIASASTSIVTVDNVVIMKIAQADNKKVTQAKNIKDQSDDPIVPTK